MYLPLLFVCMIAYCESSSIDTSPPAPSQEAAMQVSDRAQREATDQKVREPGYNPTNTADMSSIAGDHASQIQIGSSEGQNTPLMDEQLNLVTSVSGPQTREYTGMDWTKIAQPIVEQSRASSDNTPRASDGGCASTSQQVSSGINTFTIDALLGDSSTSPRSSRSDATAKAYQMPITASAARRLGRVDDATASAGPRTSTAAHGTNLWKIVVCMAYKKAFPKIIVAEGKNSEIVDGLYTSFTVKNYDLLEVAWTLSGHRANYGKVSRILPKTEHSFLRPRAPASPLYTFNKDSAELKEFCSDPTNLQVSADVEQVSLLYDYDNPRTDPLGLPQVDFEARVLLKLITYFCENKEFNHIVEYKGKDHSEFVVKDASRLRIAWSCYLRKTKPDSETPTTTMLECKYLERGTSGRASEYKFNRGNEVVNKWIAVVHPTVDYEYDNKFLRQLYLLRADVSQAKTREGISSGVASGSQFDQAGSNVAAEPGKNTPPMTSQTTSTKRQHAPPSRHELPKLSTSASVREGEISDSKVRSTVEPEHPIVKQAKTSSQKVPASDEDGSTTSRQQHLPIINIISTPTRSDSSKSAHQQSRSDATTEASGGSTGMRRNRSRDTLKALDE